MLVLDTCALVWDALSPAALSGAARAAIARAEGEGELACCTITLLEVAMLVSKGRLEPGTEVATFLDLALTARGVRVLPLTPAIAQLSAELGLHGDPADRIIAATTVWHGATLVTADERLLAAEGVRTLW